MRSWYWTAEYLCIHEIPRLATQSNQPLLQPIPVVPPQQPYQEEVSPEFMDLDIPDLIDASEDAVSDFDACAQDVLDYQR